MLYFDHNATSPLSAKAREAWLDAVERFIGNPSSQHRLGQRAERAMEDARERLAALLGCKAAEVIWTSGATEAVNTAVASFANREGEAWVSAIEHPCMLESVKHWFAGRTRLIPVGGDGFVDLDWLQDRFAEGKTPAFVGVMAANNETGVLQPWREGSELCRNKGIPFFCDAAQWIGKLPGVGLGGCHGLAGCAHKYGGPQGVGFLILKQGARALLRGGPQEAGLRAGTENVAGILAAVAALEDRPCNLSSTLRDEFEARLQQSLPQIEVVGRTRERLWNTSAIIMPEIDCRQRWVVKLDRQRIAVSTGSACASGKEQPSHVLSAMGLSAGHAGRALRFSAGWNSTATDWAKLHSAIMRAADETGLFN